MGVAAPFLEAFSVLLAAFYLVLRLREPSTRQRTLIRLVSVAVAAALADDLAGWLFGVHQYSSDFTYFIHRSPWLFGPLCAIAIDAAWRLALCFHDAANWRAPVIASVIFLGDALVALPIATAADLVHWRLPGIFGVPPVALCAWCAFGAACFALWHYNDKATTTRRLWWDALVMPIPPALTLLVLLATWWGLWRWVSAPWNGLVVVLLAWWPAAAAAAWFLTVRLRDHVPEVVIWPRLFVTAFAFIVTLTFASSLLLVFLFAFALMHGTVAPWWPVGQRLKPYVLRAWAITLRLARAAYALARRLRRRPAAPTPVSQQHAA
jgi:hypothetical protein